MDLNKLTVGDKVIGASGILLFVFAFLPWYGLAGGSRNGWDYFVLGVIPVLLGLLMVATVVVTKLTDAKLPELPLPIATILLIVGGIAAVLVLLRVVIGDSVSTGLGGLGASFGIDIPSKIDLDRKFGLFLALLAALGLVGGAFLATKETTEAASD